MELDRIIGNICGIRYENREQMGTLIGEWRTDGELDRGIRKSWRIRCSRGMGNRWGIR